MRQLKILVVSDYYKLHTGFACVTRNLIKRLKKLNPNLDFYYLGWFYDPQSERQYPDYIDRGKAYITDVRDKNDMYAAKTFPKILSREKFDVVWGIGDSVPGYRCTVIKKGGQIKLISYDELFELFEDRKYTKGKYEIIDLSGEDIFVLSGKMENFTQKVVGCWRSIRKIVRYYYKGENCTVQQRHGETITSKNHSLITKKDGKLEKIKPELISEKSPLVPIDILPPAEEQKDFVDLSYLFQQLSLDIEGEAEVGFTSCKNKIINPLRGEKLKAFCRILGAYVSEGCVSTSRGTLQRTRISNGDKMWLQSLKEDFEKITTGTGSINKHKEDSQWTASPKPNYTFTGWGVNIAYVLKKLCGDSCYNKRIPDFIFNLAREYQIEFLEQAVSGDGWFNKDKPNHQKEYHTSSYRLACGICLLGKMLGYRVSIKTKKSKNKNYTIRFSLYEKNTQPKTYSEKQNYQGFMYDLEVEGTHIFTEALGLVLLHNTWMVEPLAEHNVTKNYTLVIYTPIDSLNPPYKAYRVLEKADELVMYTRWGDNALKAKFPDLKTHIIPHGVDVKTFYPLDPEERKQIRKSFNLPENAFLIGNFNRNQPRKNIPELHHAFRYFIDPWKSCPQCGLVLFATQAKEKFGEFEKITECPRCGNKKLYEGEGKDNAYLFLHMMLNSPPERGWNITEKPWGGEPGGLIEDFSLKGHVLHTEGISVGKGLPDDVLNQLYNTMDLMVNVSAAEGFGFTSIEAMSAGTIPLISDYGGHLDFVTRPIQRVKNASYRPQPVNNVIWVLPDILDFVKKMDIFYYDNPRILQEKYGFTKKIPCGKQLREACAKEDRSKVLKLYNWDKVALMWLQLLERIKLKDKIRPGDKIRLTAV